MASRQGWSVLLKGPFFLVAMAKCQPHEGVYMFKYVTYLTRSSYVILLLIKCGVVNCLLFVNRTMLESMIVFLTSYNP